MGAAPPSKYLNSSVCEKNGKVFYACEKGKDCGFMTWDLPTKETCPVCGSTLFKKFGKLICEKEGCTFEGKNAGKDN